MNHALRSFLLTLCLVAGGCAEGYTDRHSVGDGGDLNPQKDPNNCGSRGNVCIGTGDDVCFEGYCRCNGNADCHRPDQCRDGVCIAAVPKGASCYNDTECSTGHYCIHELCTPRAYLTEVCDGHDNDGDGLTDEPEDTDKSCYSGPKEKLGIGACHAGNRVCLTGGKYSACLNEFVPHPEIGRFSCDGEDSDCDTCIDATGAGTLGCTPASPPKVDFVFMIDNSGSMSGYIRAAKEAAATYAVQFKDDDRFRFSVLLITSLTAPDSLEVLQPIGDYESFLGGLARVPEYGNDTEPTWDAIYKTATGTFDAEFGFRPDAMQAYIIFGDEPGQTVMVPPMTELTACLALDLRGALLAVVGTASYFGDYSDCAGKFLMELSTDVAAMTANLDKVLNLPCFKGRP